MLQCCCQDVFLGLKTETWVFRSRDQDQDLGLHVSRPRPRPWPSGLETKTETWVFMSRDQDRDLGHQVSRPRPGSSGLETETWVFRFRDQVRDLGRQVSRLRPRPGQNELECTRVSRPWSRDHNTVVLTVVLILFLICIYPMSQKNGTTILHNGITSQSDGRFSLFFRC